MYADSGINDLETIIEYICEAYYEDEPRDGEPCEYAGELDVVVRQGMAEFNCPECNSYQSLNMDRDY